MGDSMGDRKKTGLAASNQLLIDPPSELSSYVHTRVKAPDPIRTPKLSILGPAQYYGGGPRGNRR